MASTIALLWRITLRSCGAKYENGTLFLRASLKAILCNLFNILFSFTCLFVYYVFSISCIFNYCNGFRYKYNKIVKNCQNIVSNCQMTIDK